jgi:hypothetical protein
MYSCVELINKGLIVRIIVTIVSFIGLQLTLKSGNKFVNKYFLLILPAILLFLDYCDVLHLLYVDRYGHFKPFTNEGKCRNKLNVKFRKYNPKNGTLVYYNSVDKCLDTLSYIVAYFMFNLDNVFSYFLIYRIIGVLLYMLTLNSKWFIIFFDFTKEYLIYYYFFNNNYKYLLIFIILKIYFEIHIHMY